MPTDRTVGDHVCWPYRHQTELAAVASGFVVEGLGRNERVAYLGPGRPGELRADLAGIPGLDERVDRGQLQLTDIAALPASDPLTDPVFAAMQMDETKLARIEEQARRMFDGARRLVM